MSVKRAQEDLLVISAQMGDERAFEGLFKIHHPALLGFAYRLCGDQTLAADAVQDAWITLSKSLRKLKDPRGFRTWAYKTVRWRVVDRARRQKVQTTSLEALGDVSDQSGEPDATPDQIAGRIGTLDPADRQLLALFYLDELKLSEIAGVLDVPLGTVKSRLNRARARLRQQNEGED